MVDMGKNDSHEVQMLLSKNILLSQVEFWIHNFFLCDESKNNSGSWNGVYILKREREEIEISKERINKKMLKCVRASYSARP